MFMCGALFFSCSDSEVSSNVDNSIVDSNVLSISDIANNLGNSFTPTTRSAIENGIFDYPDYYGGMCVKNNEKLIVFVLDGDLDFLEEILGKDVGALILNLEFVNIL